MTVTTSTTQQVQALTAECAAPGEATELFARLSQRLSRLVPFDGGCWFATDLATALGASCPVRIENVESGHCESYWEREFLVSDDLLLFRDLARSVHPARFAAPPRPTAIPRAAPATGSSSPRRATPMSYAVFPSRGDLGRARPVPGTRPGAVLHAGEVDLVGESCRPSPGVCARWRCPRAERRRRGAGRAGHRALRRRHRLTLDEQAEGWLTELAGCGWNAAEPPAQLATVTAVLARAHAIAAGRDRRPASARLRSATGRWLLVHASCLRTPSGDTGPTALIIEPASLRRSRRSSSRPTA